MSSKERDSKQAKAKERGERIGMIIAGVFFFVIVTLGLTAVIGPHFYGATPAEIMAEPLACSPKQLAHDLTMTSSHSNGVLVTFRKGAAGEYETADFKWAPGTSDAPQSMRLRAEHGAEIEHEVTAVLQRRLRTLRDGRFRWGPVTIRVSDEGDVSFEIDREVNGHTNALFARQVEAAKQVVLNAAFGLPLRLSDREIADALGTGYAPAALAKLNVESPLERVGATLAASFPAALASSSASWDVPIDHPLVEKASLTWDNRPGGTLSSVSLRVNKAYQAARPTLAACLEKKLGAAARKDYAFLAGKIGLKLREDSILVSTNASVDQASFALLFESLDGCRDAPETGAATK